MNKQIVPVYRRWSESKIHLLEQCPLSFRLRYIDKAEVPVGVELAFGAAIHYFLQRFFVLKNGFKSADTFAKSFAGFWQGVTSAKHGPEGYGSEPIELRYRRQKTESEKGMFYGWGDNILKQFYRDNWCYRDGTEPMPCTVEKRYFLRWCGHQITGKIDRVQPFDKDKRAVIDYKTGPPYRSEVEQRLDLQFTIYSLFIYREFGRFPDKMEWWFLKSDSIEKMELSRRRKTDFIELKCKIEEAERFVQGALMPGSERCLLADQTFHYFCFSAIKSPHFYRNVGQHCRWCDYDKICAEITIEDPYRSKVVTRQMQSYKNEPPLANQLILEGLEVKKHRKRHKDLPK